MEQKHFIDIERLKEGEHSNALSFEPGDIISIQEKYDGSNASVCYDEVKDEIVAFSRNQQLSPFNTLCGFYNYVQQLPDAAKEFLKNSPECVIFGEWNAKNHIKYDCPFNTRWLVYDIYNKVTQAWYDAEFVSYLCKTIGLEFIHELYRGPFISWDHCREFLHKNTYGPIQEGIVIKNMTKANAESRYPAVLKIVNQEFQEIRSIKEVDPDKEKLRSEAEVLGATIVTEARVRKMMLKLRDEEVLPEALSIKDMSIVAKNIPKRIYEDCMKEEPDTVIKMGEYAGKVIGKLSINIARELVENEL